MRKLTIAVSAVALGTVFAYFISGKSISIGDFGIDSKSDHKQAKSQNLKKKKQTAVEFLEANGIEALKTALDKKNLNTEQFQVALVKSLNKFGKCLKDKSCLLKGKENNFHDPSMDPVFLKIKNLLDGIEYIAFSEPEILDKIKDQELYDLMQFENSASFYLANAILFNKGRQSILGSKVMAQNLSSNLLGSYLKLVSDKSLLEDKEIRELRNELIDNYLSSSDSSKMLTTLNTINGLHFNTQEAQAIKTSFCAMDVEGNSEGSKVLNAKFTKFVMKYNIDSKC